MSETDDLAARLERWADEVDPATDEVPIDDTSDLRAIASAVDNLRQGADVDVAQAVKEAYRNGRTWTQIAIALDMSPQAARDEYGWGNDWAADVRKFRPDAELYVIKAIVMHCGIALQRRDSALVSFNDPEELRLIREGFLKKKLGLALADRVLDDAIVATGRELGPYLPQNRVTVYYLLAEHFDRLDLFR